MSFIDKYAPRRWSEVVIPDPVAKMQLDNWVQTQSMRPILFHGPPGTGKTTMASLLPREVDPTFSDFDLLDLQASSTSNNASRLQQLHNFCPMMSFSDARVVKIDEFDMLPNIMQGNMKNVMDKYKLNTRFFLTTNHINKVDPAVRSRCLKLSIVHNKMDAWVPRLRGILAIEGMAGRISDEKLLDIADVSHGDCRTILQDLEHLILKVRLNTPPSGGPAPATAKSRGKVIDLHSKRAS
jgi:DNA polymerase III delta prime subunit